MVLMAELSGAITLVPVIALGSATATAVGNLFGKGASMPTGTDRASPPLAVACAAAPTFHNAELIAAR